MTHFPLFTDLMGRSILIFGGKKHALQRIKKLLPFSPVITVISPCISQEIKDIPDIILKERAFLPEDLDEFPVLAIIAESKEITAEIHALCKERHIPVNAVDMPEYCDVIFPSVISSEHLCIGISSGGISPSATLEFKESFEKLIPENIDEILEWMPEAKSIIKENALESRRNALLREAFRTALERKEVLGKNELMTLINRD